MRDAPVATIVGLVVAIGGVALLASPASRVLGDPARLRTQVLDQMVLWLLFAAVIAIVLFWERLPLASIGLKPFAWRSLALGAVFAAVVMWIATPIGTFVASKAGLPLFDAGIAEFAQRPLWLRILAVVTAGVVEETLFRGYALERIASLCGNEWLAAALTLAVFTAVHWPVWGAGPVLVFVFTGGALTAAYVWQHDLLANAIAHVVVDAMGLIVMPALSLRS
jgi:uncharacterized protein